MNINFVKNIALGYEGKVPAAPNVAPAGGAPMKPPASRASRRYGDQQRQAGASSTSLQHRESFCAEWCTQLAAVWPVAGAGRRSVYLVIAGEPNGLRDHDNVFVFWRLFGALEESLGVLLEFSDPDIAEADGFAVVAVRLQLDGRGIVLFIEGLADE